MSAIETPSQELLSERVAGGILPRVLNSFDMVAIFVAIVLFITNAAVIQSAGPSAFGWWVLGFILFFIPGAIVTGQLGRMFPGEGSIYLWTHKAFGPFWGFFAGFCAWWPGVLVMVATGTSVIAFLSYVFPTVGSWNVYVDGLLIIGFILVSAVLAVLRFRVTQNVVNLVFLLYGLAIFLMVLGGIGYLLKGHHQQVNPWNWTAYKPSSPLGLNFTNWTFFGLVILALLGVEVPLNMGVEIKHARSITRYLFWGSLAVMVAYLTVTWAVMVSVSPKNGTSASLTAVALAAQAGLGSWAGKLVALILAAFFLFITVVYNYSFARLIFVSGLDRRLPRRMAHVNRNRVPDAAVWVQTAVAVVFAVVAFLVFPALKVGGGTPIAAETKVYDVLQAAVTVIWCVSMVVLFVDILIILRRFADAFRATRLAHPAVFWVCSVFGAVAALIGIVSTLSGSWTPLISNTSGSLKLGGATVHYGTWFWLVAGIAVLSLAVGALLYEVGRRTSRRGRMEPAMPAAAGGTR